MSPVDLERQLAAYLAVRQALGYAMRAERTLLADFVRFLIDGGDLNPIRAQAAVDWATRRSEQRGTSGTATRLTMARRFLSHLRATHPDTEVPEYGLVATARRPTPFLFNDADIERLLAAAQQARPRDSLRPYTLSTLLGLLASTGLRVGEAVRLTVSDVPVVGHTAAVARAPHQIRQVALGADPRYHGSPAGRLSRATPEAGL